jgi:phosphoglycerate dehydrogenase-like enzyme
VVALPGRFREHLRNLPNEVSVDWYQDAESSLQAASTAEIMWFDSHTSAPIGQILEVGSRLRWVSLHQVGVDKIPLADFARRRIRLTNAAGHYAIPIAEYTVMAILAWAKRLPKLIKAQDDEVWLQEPPGNTELFGSRALIIGYGGIGRAVGARLFSLGVDTIGVRTRARPPRVIGPDDWRSRLGEFDWVLICAPLTKQTTNLIGEPELAAMKRGACLANTSRGAMVDTDALVKSLKAGHLGGAYLDVTDPEPLPKGHELWRMPNTLITPHSSWASDRFARRTSDFFVENLERFRDGKRLRNLVNLRQGY